MNDQDYNDCNVDVYDRDNVVENATQNLWHHRWVLWRGQHNIALNRGPKLCVSLMRYHDEFYYYWYSDSDDIRDHNSPHKTLMRISNPAHWIFRWISFSPLMKMKDCIISESMASTWRLKPAIRDCGDMESHSHVCRTVYFEQRNR